MELTIITIVIGLALLMVAIKICKTIISKVIMAVISGYMILGDSLDFPNILKIISDFINSIF